MNPSLQQADLDVRTNPANLLPRDIRDTDLAAACATLGFRIKANYLDGPELRTAEHPYGVVTWQISPMSMDGKYMLGDVLAAWKNEEWLNNPANESPLCMICTALLNRARLNKLLREARPLVHLRHANRYAIYDARMDQRAQDNMIQFIERGVRHVK